MAGVGGFRGVSAAQDSRFSDKNKKLLKTMKFPKEYDLKVDFKRVELDVMKPWIAKRVTELLGVEDEVMISYIYTQLEGGDERNDPRMLQINLTPFLEKNTSLFLKELWSLLASATENGTEEAPGIPQQFLEEKAEQLRKEKEARDKIDEKLRQDRERRAEEARLAREQREKAEQERRDERERRDEKDRHRDNGRADYRDRERRAYRSPIRRRRSSSPRASPRRRVGRPRSRSPMRPRPRSISPRRRARSPPARRIPEPRGRPPSPSPEPRRQPRRDYRDDSPASDRIASPAKRPHSNHKEPLATRVDAAAQHGGYDSDVEDVSKKEKKEKKNKKEKKKHKKEKKAKKEKKEKKEKRPRIQHEPSVSRSASPASDVSEDDDQIAKRHLEERLRQQALESLKKNRM